VSPISPAKAKREALFYRDRLMRMRKSNDAWPWIEVKHKLWSPSFSGSGDPTQQDTIVLKEPKDLFISELVHHNVANGLNAANAWSNSAVAWEAQLQRGTQGVGDYSTPIIAFEALGEVWDEVKRFRTGMRVPPQQQRSVFARTAPSTFNPALMANGFDHSLWLGWRGYQLFAKGSNPYLQLTYSEYADRGYVAEPFTAAVNIYPLNLSKNEAPAAEYICTDDFAVDYITIALNTLSPGSNYLTLADALIKLEPPGRPIMQDFCPAPLLGLHLARSAWLWDQPLFAPKNERWVVRMKSLLGINYAAISHALDPNTRITVSLHGHKLIKP
jgi:hypothetical protein